MAEPGDGFEALIRNSLNRLKTKGVGKNEHAPPKGSLDRLFYISRVKMSRRIAAMPLEKKLGYIVEVRKFSGDASLGRKIPAGNPYLTIWKD